MLKLKEKLPDRVTIKPVFATAIFMTHSWTIMRYLWELPGWMHYVEAGDMLVILAYSLSSALLESLAILAPLLIMTIFLPKSFSDNFAPLGSAIVIFLAVWSLVVLMSMISQRLSPASFLVWPLVLIIGVLCLSFLIHRYAVLNKAMTALANRMEVFLYLYVPLGLLSLTYLCIRYLIKSIL